MFKDGLVLLETDTHYISQVTDGGFIVVDTSSGMDITAYFDWVDALAAVGNYRPEDLKVSPLELFAQSESESEEKEQASD